MEKKLQQLKIAEEYSSFTGVETILLDADDFHQFQAHIPFLYESAFINGLDILKPWEKPEKYVLTVMEQWEKLKDELGEKFSKREQEGIEPLMRKAIAYFYEMLFWCNEKPAILKQSEIAMLLLKPINAGERLSFITARPAHYHSYIQLNQLFLELQKIFLKEQSRKKASKQ